MAIFSELELLRMMNESKDEDGIIDKVGDRLKVNTEKIKDAGKEVSKTTKNNLWVTKQKQKKENKGNKITFKEDANGNIIDCQFDDESIEEGFKKVTKKTIDKTEDITRDLTNKSAVAIEKEKQDWVTKPGAKTGETIGNVVTGGNVVNTVGKASGRFVGSKIDDIIHKKSKERKKLKEEANSYVYRSPEYTKVMNEFFDITDTETRKILLAVNESDQNKVLVSLTSKLYDNVVDKVDDIDFGEIELTKGDIEKLPNFGVMCSCLDNMKKLLIEFKQDTHPVDTINECIGNLIDSKGIWTKAYAVNAELPMITYNTMTLAVIEATSYMVSMCVDFIKSPSQDTMQIMINKSGLTKSKGHMLFKNIESFNSAYRKGQIEKAMMHVIDDNAKKKNFVGVGLGVGIGATVVGIAGLLFCIVPIIRELIFLFYYYRVRVSEFFEVQADMLQINAYNIENNRLDLTKEERKTISSKQMKTADKFRSVSRTIAVDGTSAENKASKDIKAESNKKYKASDVMDELPDSASSALF